MASCLRRFLHAWNPLKAHGAYEADGILDGMLTKQPFLLKSRNRIGENVQLTFPSLPLCCTSKIPVKYFVHAP